MFHGEEAEMQTHWSLREAAEFAAAHREALHRRGFVLGVYGSALWRDDARDLDLMAWAWHSDADAVAAVQELCLLSGADIADHGEGLMGSLFFALVLPGGRVVDLQFRGQARVCPACGNAAV